MVRDLIMQMKERDLSFEDKSNSAMPTFDTIWGNIFDEDNEIEVLICNVIVPEAYWSMIKFDDEAKMECRFQSAYVPRNENFRIRLVKLKDGKYSHFDNLMDQYGVQVNSYALNRNIAVPISACMLPYIDIDGEFIVKLMHSSKAVALDRAYIYSGKSTDIEVNYSDDQASQLLSLMAPGNYRYPTSGVGIVKYLNCVIEHSDLYSALESQFELDNKPLINAEFDNETCDLDVLFTPEPEEEDAGLTPISNLGMDFFSLFTDEFVRRNIVLSELSDIDFISLLNGYDSVLEIIMFRDYTTTVTRIADKVEPACFNGVGDTEPSDEFFIVTATLEPYTIIMFDDETEDDVHDAPIFTINDVDETRLYTALVEQPYWIAEQCNKCFILKHRSTLRYMIRQEQFKHGKGLYIVPQTSANIKNMLGLVQDVNTGRLLGIVSNSTNISDITLDEVTQHIYATQINQ